MHRALFTFLLIFIAAVITACASDTNLPQVTVGSKELTGSWQIESIDQGGIVDFSKVTLQIDEQNQISGSTGCNQYAARLEALNNAFVVSNVNTTRRACVPAIDNQEQRFLAALSDATRYEIESETWMIIYDALDMQRIKMTQLEYIPELHNGGPGGSSELTSSFNCEGAGILEVRFIGPETLEASTEIGVAVLQRSRSASGALFTGENIQFWDKGNEALLVMEGEEFGCDRRQF